jgi:hypothetical protein
MLFSNTEAVQTVAAAPSTYAMNTTSRTSSVDDKTSQVRKRVLNSQHIEESIPRDQEELDWQLKNQCCCIFCGFITSMFFGVFIKAHHLDG